MRVTGASAFGAGFRIRQPVHSKLGIKPAIGLNEAVADTFVRQGASANVVRLTFGYLQSAQCGVTFEAGKTCFKLWAPAASDQNPDKSRAVELVVLRPPHPGEPSVHGIMKNGNDYLRAQESLRNRIVQARFMVPDPHDPTGSTYQLDTDLPPGTLYMYRFYDQNGNPGPLFPDMRSRFQPEDVHGPSQVMKLDEFKWEDQDWKTPSAANKNKKVIYRLHIGTLTRQGTFEAALQELQRIKELGFTDVEVMPVAEFPGKRNWGYDVIDYFAVESAYGGPVAFQKFVNECHKQGLGVILDVVYNHIGPDGAFFTAYDKGFVDGNGEWGAEFNWQNPQARAYVREAQEAMLRDFHVDGFRYDMSSRIPDDVQREYLRHNFQVKKELPTGPELFTAAEDERSSKHVTQPQALGGLGYTTKWDFPYHHRLGSIVTGKKLQGGDVYSTNPWDLRHQLEEGFPGPVPRSSRLGNLNDRVIFYQSHDEIANGGGFRRGLERIQEAKVGNPANWRARYMVGSLLKYLVPGVPFNFMGEEYLEQKRYYFFADHYDPQTRRNTSNSRGADYDIFGPQCFEDSKLDRAKADLGMERATRDVIALRQNTPALWQGGRNDGQGHLLDMKFIDTYMGSKLMMLHRWGVQNREDEAVILVNFSDYNYINNEFKVAFPNGEWQEVFNTADRNYAGPLSAGYEGLGNTNQGQRIQGGAEAGLNIPPWSIAVFRKQSGAHWLRQA